MLIGGTTDVSLYAGTAAMCIMLWRIAQLLVRILEALQRKKD
jgi:hypothetical protein